MILIFPAPCDHDMTASFLTDDLDVILDKNVFGETNGCVWKGNAVTGVIFDDEDVEVFLGEGVPEIVPQPVLTAKTSDFVGIDTGDTVTVAGGSFTVKNWKKDGTGMIHIFLNRVS